MGGAQSESAALLMSENARGSKIHGRFAVIKLWPNLKTAEDECIARLKNTAKCLGLECLEVDSFARLLAYPHTQLTQADVDFVLNLHFETPKRYDIFSFVALWNPLQFFHDWGYRRFTRHLLTHDDFLSCGSRWADDHIRRHLATDPMREPPQLHLYHSLSEPILPPTTGESKLFYAGINWERISNKPQRNGKLLSLLDKTGDLQIYGPKLFQGVEVWAGYKSYHGPVPFDGASMVRLIHKAGVSLVLSSEAHRESELMSSRLFESLAAGAVIICDDNPFARRHFGKTLLYIDTTLEPEQTFEEIQSHLIWIRSEPEKARELARQAQEIFRNEFSLDHCLQSIYRELPARKKRLESLRVPIVPEEKISVIFLMPRFQPEILERHITSYLAQRNVCTRAIIAMDERDFEIFGARVRARIEDSGLPLTLEALKFMDRYPNGTPKSYRRLGALIQEAIQDFAADDYFCLVGPHERLFSDHLASLLRVLQENPQAGSAWSDSLWSHVADGANHADLADEPSLDSLRPDKPISLARFLFRKSALPEDLAAALPYLNSLSMVLLFGITASVPTKRCSVVADIQNRFCSQIITDSKPAQEIEILIDYAPAVFRSPVRAFTSPSIDSLTQEQKVKLAVELAHSVPVPGIFKRMAFGLYRFWLRRYNARKNSTNL